MNHGVAVSGSTVVIGCPSRSLLLSDYLQKGHGNSDFVFGYSF
jgi:hypothetical protein